MLRAYATEQIRQAEAKVVAAAATDSLMKRAAEAVAGQVIAEIEARGQVMSGSVVAGLAGGGDNGGDALYALAFLREVGAECVALCLHPKPHPRALAAAKKAGVEVITFESDRTAGEIVAEVVSVARQAGAWIDGMLGSGAKGDLREPYASVCRALAQEKYASPDEPIVVAVDIPTGLWEQDGSIPGPFLPADVTVTMGAPKPQLLLAPSAWEVGRLEVLDLGLDLAEPAFLRRLYAPDICDNFHIPTARDHKYTRGVVQVVAGSNAFPMTGIMCVEGAARAGAGMVRFWGPDEAALAVLSRLPEAVAQQGRFQALLTGPGIDPQDKHRVDLALSVSLSARQKGLPQVLDAGALQYLQQVLDFPRQDSPTYLLVLTPHAGEAAWLLTTLDPSHPISRHQVEECPFRYAQKLHKMTGATIVLKGANTVIVGADGNCYCQAEAPGWAGTAGSGDVLAGIITSVLASFQARLDESNQTQPLSPDQVALAAAVGVWIHGTAAALAAGSDLTSEPTLLLYPGQKPQPGQPILASDIARYVPDAIGLAIN